MSTRCQEVTRKLAQLFSLSCPLDLQLEPGVAITGTGKGKGQVCNNSSFGRPAQITELEIAAASLGEGGGGRREAGGSLTA